MQETVVVLKLGVKSQRLGSRLVSRGRNSYSHITVNGHGNEGYSMVKKIVSRLSYLKSDSGRLNIFKCSGLEMV